MRERWRVSEREIVLLYVGRVSREKGLALLPELLYRLRALGVRHRMVVAGDGPYRKALQEELPDAVFTGLVNRTEVASVFASADVFVFPSMTDTAGNVVLEAQASGLPVVVSSVGGPCEQMRPEVTGVVCDSANARSWAEAIAWLAGDPARRAEISRSAREFALGRRWSHALAPLYQAYRDAARAIGRTTTVHHAA